MTADVNFDFQSRPVIITRTAWPPGNLYYRVWGVSLKSRAPQGKFSSFSVLQRTIRATSLQDAPQVAILSGRAPRSLLPGSTFDRLPDKSNCRQSISYAEAPFHRLHPEIDRTVESPPKAVHWQKRKHQALLGIAIPDRLEKPHPGSRPGNGPRLCSGIVSTIHPASESILRLAQDRGLRSLLPVQDEVGRFCPPGFPLHPLFHIEVERNWSAVPVPEPNSWKGQS